MFLPVYILTLGVSAGIVGAFGRRLAAAQGLMPDFDTGVMLTWGIAAAYAASQLLFMTFLRAAKPTRSAGPLLSECLSHLTALLLAPYLLNVPVPWPHPILFRVEPLLYFGIFSVAHSFFKLMTLFSTTRSAPAGRAGAAGWAAASLAALYGIFAAYTQWQTSIESARLAPLPAEQAARAGDVHAAARLALEDAVYTFDLPAGGDRNLVLRWSNPPDAGTPLAEFAVHLWIDGKMVKLPAPTLLLGEGWTELRIPAAMLRGGAQCGVSWSSQVGADWMEQLGLRMLRAGGRSLWLSGPYFHAGAGTLGTPNVIILAVDGLAAEHVGHLGYGRDTAPALAAFARDASTFSHAFTPAPEAAAACTTLLTGVNPLVHQYLGMHRGPLPEELVPLQALLHDKGYATAAFTEAEGSADVDLAYGGGFERGFEVFDPMIPEKGSAATLEKAADWLERNAEDQSLVFVRLRELQHLAKPERYGSTFTGEQVPFRPLDLYDNAITYLDKQIGEFLARVKARPEMQDACIVIASAYGLDFSAGWNARGEAALTESSLRVPLYIQAAGQARGASSAIVELEDVAPTLATLLQVDFPQVTTGMNLLEAAPGGDAISMSAEPLALSLRNDLWRFTWQSGLFPFTQVENAEQGVIEFFNISYYERKWRQPDNLRQQPTLAYQYRDRLWNYVKAGIERENEELGMKN